jgi:IPT/TIG domain-containing protein
MTKLTGIEGDGTVFSMATGLGPFVSLQPNAGLLNNTINILGQGLTGSTSVSFNGAAAKFKVVSDIDITATVPVTATTGPVTVTTPGGKLTSNQPFRVVASVSARP